jgi:MFS family permease
MPRSIAILCLLTAVDMIGFGIVIPLIPYFGEQLGAGPFTIAAIIASFPATQLLMSSVWGRLSDRTGRKPILVLGLWASAVSYIMFANVHSIAGLLASRILAGAAGATVGVAQAFVADVTDESKRAQGIGYLGAAYGVGAILGPIISSFAISNGYATVGWIAAAICGLNALAAHRFLREPDREGRPAQTAAPLREIVSAYLRPPLRRLALVYFLVLSAFDGTMAVYALLYQETLQFSARDIGLLWAWAGVVTVLARGRLVGIATKYLEEAQVVSLGGALMFAGLLFAPFAWDWRLAYVATSVSVLGSSLCLPSISSMISKTTEGRSLGALMGSAQLIAGTARVMGPIILGSLFQLLGSKMAFVVAALVSAAGGALALSRQLKEAGSLQRAARAAS